MRYRSVVGLCALALLTQVAVACDVYDATLVPGSGGGGGGGDILSVVPPRPVMNPLPDVADTPTVALRNVILNQQGGRWREIGIDLDGVDSVPGGEQGCEPTDQTGAMVWADGEGGIDNVFGAHFYFYINLYIDVDPEEGARAAHDIGDGTMITRLSNWNGTANDEQVTITIAQAVDGTSLPRDQVYMDEATHQLMLVDSPGVPAPPPQWNPAQPDNWWVREDGFFQGDPTMPFQQDTNAYIADGVVVNTLQDRPIVFKMGEHAVQVIYRDARVLATLSEDFHSLTNVVVAGRWTVLDLLETATGVDLCPQDSQYGILRNEGYKYADVINNASLDGTGAVCDSVSMAVRFEEGVPANWEPTEDSIVPGPPIRDYCAERPPLDGGV
jgi:hypothetical protein